MITDDYIMFGLLALCWLLLLFIGYKSANKAHESGGKVFLILFVITWIIIPFGVLAPLEYFGLQSLARWIGIINGIVGGLTVIVCILLPMAFAAFVAMIVAFLSAPSTTTTVVNRNGVNW